MQKITRQALLDFLRLEARKRFRKQADMKSAFGGDTRFITRANDEVDYQIYTPSWDRLLQMLGRLGFEVRFEIVRKEPSVRTPSTRMLTQRPELRP